MTIGAGATQDDRKGKVRISGAAEAVVIRVPFVE